MRVHNGHFERLRRVLTAGVVALLTAAPVLAEAAQPAAAAAYVPATADYLGVYDALQRYRLGVDKHDAKMLASAFWEDGANIAVPSPGVEIRMPLDGSPPQPPAGQPGPNMGLPPGSNPGMPGPNAGPPPGPNAGPPGPGGPGGEEVWHLPLDSYIHFESATRATHYGYFLSIYPQKEKKVAGDHNMASMRDARTSTVGWPGHYEDILEKRNGEWRILSRKSVINQK